jgi:hypothetical protein
MNGLLGVAGMIKMIVRYCGSFPKNPYLLSTSKFLISLGDVFLEGLGIPTMVFDIPQPPPPPPSMQTAMGTEVL